MKNCLMQRDKGNITTYFICQTNIFIKDCNTVIFIKDCTCKIHYIKCVKFRGYKIS